MTYNKWRKFNYKMKECGRKDSLVGAQIRLDEFQQKLCLFDNAFEKMYHNTVTQDQLGSFKKRMESFST